MLIQLVTLFPQLFDSFLEFGVIARAQKKGLWSFNAINPRDFSGNKLGYIDDRPFGGGPGMVMQAEPVYRAIQKARENQQSGRLIYLSPQGKTLTQELVLNLSQESHLILLCGRYEGIDERLLIETKVEEISVGDFVVSGGEIPAMLLIDSVLRHVDGVLGDEQSAIEDSFIKGLLDCPHYTRPIEFCGHGVPEVLLSGNHAQIARWRLKESLKRTLERRPDLLKERELSPQESCLLDEIKKELQDNPY